MSCAWLPRFDSELNTVKEEAQSERSEKEKAMREKSALQSEFTELQQSLKVPYMHLTHAHIP